MSNCAGPMRLQVLALSLAIGVPLAAQEVVHPVELPPISMSEAAAIPLRDPQPRVFTHRLLPPLRYGVRAAASLTVTAVTTPTIAAPPVTALFDADASRALVPADSAGAVGRTHVVSTNNARIIVQDRAGKILKTVSQDQFWSLSPGALPVGEYYDPRVAYDASADRWILLAIHDEKAIAFAISETGDPAGVWRRYMLDEPGADFSMLAVTRDRLVIGTNTSGGDGTLLSSMRKQDLYNRAPEIDALRYRINKQFLLPVSSNGGQQYIVVTDGSGITVMNLNDLAWSINVHEPNDWDTAPFRTLPQFSSVALDAGYGLLEAVAERDGWIYAVMIRDVGPDTQAVAWCRVNTTTRQSEWGAVGDPVRAARFAYPSLAVNRYGGMLIGFGTFASDRYPSSAYVYRDFMGRVSNIAPIRAGTDAVTVHERWGDYTTTVIDPLDDASFWTVQIHAKNGSWATSWAKVEMNVVGKRRAVRR